MEIIKGDDNINRMVLLDKLIVVFTGIFVFFSSKWVLKMGEYKKKMEIREQIL
jgi:hypothetical protein